MDSEHLSSSSGSGSGLGSGVSLEKAPEDHADIEGQWVTSGSAGAGAPMAKPVKPVEGTDEEEFIEELEADIGAGRKFGASLFQGAESVFVSMVVHAVVLILLAVLTMSEQTRRDVREMVASLYDEEEEEIIEVELDQQIEAAEEMTISVMSAVPDSGAAGSAPAETAMQLDREVVEQADASEVVVRGIEMIGPPKDRLVGEVPQGTLGDPRAIVDDYDQAMDRITQEILLALEKGPVLVIWAFDQSESMKDDQKEIRDRIERVYEELGLVDADDGDQLATAVVSYGENFADHLRGNPTNALSDIRQAIDSVPVDLSGKEMMCQAVGTAITRYQNYCRRTRRQMMLIMVTDESGEHENNNAFLELAIAKAKEADCRIYTLGREAVFGYPYAHIRWKHPETKHIHWLPINRGPETAFVEQLQTNGFHRRHDAFPSGFGPYEQTRMSRETGGVFFMLPSLETNLVRGEKRRYELDIMKAYRPNLDNRAKNLEEIQTHELRRVLTQVIYDLNPYNEAAAKIIVMRHNFSTNIAEFRQQATRQLQKVKVYLDYLAKASETVEGLEKLRQQEADPRWQANYDLIRGQLIAYQARVNEYAACLVDFGKNPKTAPPTRQRDGVTLYLHDWDLGGTRELRTPEVVQPYIDRANELFQVVIANHPGTPWAARAQQEINRGYGIELHPDYHSKEKPSGKVRIPKL